VLTKAGAQFATTEGDDTSTASGRMVINIKLAVAQQEAERISERVARAKRQLREAGYPTGGARRFGFQSDNITPEPGEIAIVLEAAERVLAGASLGDLVRWLDEARVPTVKGMPKWERITIKRILLSPRMIGYIEHQGKMTDIKAVWEPVMDRATFERVGQLLDPPERRRAPGWGSRVHLLTGIAVCGFPDCGNPLVARPYYRDSSKPASGRHTGGYVCSKERGGCGRIKRNLEKLDELVERSMIKYLLGYNIRGAVATNEPILAELDQAEARVASLQAAYDSEEGLDDEDYFPMLRKARERVNEIKGRLKRLNRNEAIRRLAGENADVLWAAASLSEKRAGIHAVMESLVVKPVGKIGRAPWPKDSVLITWATAA
jgi:hypothetical protein